jgi:glycosyltransferase involved in cell wall biosynthesis
LIAAALGADRGGGVGDRVRISGCVITYNEEARIEACLRSLALCDELLVVDSHSTDRTRERAASLGARVIERDWPGYRSQKQFAIEAAANDWVLVLDADERLSAPLAQEIESLRAAGVGDRVGFAMPRRWIYFGRELRFGDAGRDRHVRLFDRRRAAFGGFEVHERAIVAGPTGSLRGAILHDSYRDLDDQLGKLGRYARLMGESMHATGERGSWTQVLFNPGWRFFRAYVLRLGMLDGWRGLVFALLDANYVREKYLHLMVRRKADGCRSP